MEYPFPVIDLSYCAPYTINLQINTDKGATYDGNGVRRFYIKSPRVTLHDRCVLCDAGGNSILTLYWKIMTMHRRCQVYMGESNDSSRLLFSVKKAELLQSGVMRLEVFLAYNKKESECDFRVDVVSGKRSCHVYAGESPTVVASMQNNGGFNVFVYRNVDYAFIVALLMIVKDINFFYDGTWNFAKAITPVALGIMMT
ncbi:hypothetical protein VIGAN_04120300 [Vigna angularis var. angularis]|uniref:Uncharacterized protein n=1 Tax=Vigna angularis var. angularis TaxID=157739 RepID=A0A0S3RTQ9_PHAAN|nr:hypothetical protein VIGAN_04120300 [Vigna angularis var. angularis]